MGLQKPVRRFQVRLLKPQCSGDAPLRESSRAGMVLVLDATPIGMWTRERWVSAAQQLNPYGVLHTGIKKLPEGLFPSRTRQTLSADTDNLWAVLKARWLEEHTHELTDAKAEC